VDIVNETSVVTFQVVGVAPVVTGCSC